MSQSDQAFIRAYGEPPASRRPAPALGSLPATSRPHEISMPSQQPTTPHGASNYSYAGSIDVSTVSIPLPQTLPARGPVPGPHARFAAPPAVEKPASRAETVSHQAAQRPKQWMLHQPHPRPELFEAPATPSYTPTSYSPPSYAPPSYAQPSYAEEVPTYAPQPAYPPYEQQPAVAGRIAPANKPVSQQKPAPPPAAVTRAPAPQSFFKSVPVEQFAADRRCVAQGSRRTTPPAVGA